MAIEKLRPEVIEQMANHKLSRHAEDVQYLNSIIGAAKSVLENAHEKIMRGDDYFRDDNGNYIHGTFIDCVETSHGKDRLYIMNNLQMIEILNYGTPHAILDNLTTDQALMRYDADNAAHSIRDAVRSEKKPRCRVLADGKIQLETILEEIHTVDKKMIKSVRPNVGGTTCSVTIEVGPGNKFAFEINATADAIRELIDFDGFQSQGKKDGSAPPTS